MKQIGIFSYIRMIMKTKKLLMLSLATASLLTMSGCCNSKFCDWVSSCYKKACKMCKCSDSKKASVKKAAANQSILSIESHDAFQAQILESEKPVVVKLQAAWCGACQEMEPVFKKLSTQMPEITFAVLDIDQVGEIAKKYSITGVPTFLLFKDGKEVRSDNRVLGVIEEEAFRDILEESLLK
jgi:thioredoxin 1